MGREHSLLWNYFTQMWSNGKKYGICIFCETRYVSHAGKMRRHLCKCVKCPINVKREFIIKQSLDNPEFIKPPLSTKEEPSTKEELEYKYFVTDEDPNPPVESVTGACFSNEKESTEDNFDIFGRYVASEIKNLKSALLQRKLKRKILQLILDVYSEEGEVITVEVE